MAVVCSPFTEDMPRPAEIDEIKRLFTNGLASSDGKVGQDALRELIRSFATQEFTDADFKLVFDSITGSDGRLDVGAFVENMFEEVDRNCSTSANPNVGIYLAKWKGAHRHIAWALDTSEPTFAGTIDEFREQFSSSPKKDSVLDMLRNKVKACSQCKKACAYTMTECNGCGASLASTPLSYNDNVFMGFIFGIAKGKFPFKISLRAQSPSFLTFDDPLAMSPCHLNCIPADVYCPDLRYLFTDPAKGLTLVNRLFDFAADACLRQFWGNEALRETVFKDVASPKSAQDLQKIVICGFNFPPSMYQLHLQFIHPPLFPFHYETALQGIHMSYKRFFTLDYVQEALSLGDKVKMHVDDSTTIDDILAHVERCGGPSYDQINGSFQRRYKRSQTTFDTWKPEYFECTVKDNKVFDRVTQAEVEGADAKSLQAADKDAMQNYGRPYDSTNNKPTGTYFRFTKDPLKLPSFGEWAPSGHAESVQSGCGAITGFDVASGRTDEFLKVMENYIRNSRDRALDPGCLRCDLFIDQKNKNRFFLHEAFLNDDARASHEKAGHAGALTEFGAGGGAAVAVAIKTETTSIPGSWGLQGHTGGASGSTDTKRPGVAMIVNVEIKPEDRDEFFTAIKTNAIGVRTQEAGALRMDVLQDAANANRFVFVECFADEAATGVHKNTAHFKAWSTFAERGLPDKVVHRLEAASLPEWAFEG